jgi:DNA-binding MarR family transcriptional regulator
VEEENFGVEYQTKFSMIPEWLLDINITPGAYMVYGALAKYASNETKSTFVSHSTLAERLKVSRGTIINRINELKEKGCIVVENRYEDGHQKSNIYILQWTAPPVFKTVDVETEEVHPNKNIIVEDNSFQIDVEVKKKRTVTITPLWRPLVEVCGYDPKEKTKMYGSWNESIKELEKKGATPEEVYRRARLYKQRFSNKAELTPAALDKWWEALDTVQPGTAQHTISELEVRKQQIRAENKTS